MQRPRWRCGAGAANVGRVKIRGASRRSPPDRIERAGGLPAFSGAQPAEQSRVLVGFQGASRDHDRAAPGSLAAHLASGETIALHIPRPRAPRARKDSD